MMVDYRRHKWAVTAPYGYSANGCSMGFDIAEFNVTAWASYIKSTLGCHRLSAVSHVRVNGVSVLKLTGTMTAPNWWDGIPHAESTGSLKVTATIYVDPRTYLPIQLVWNNHAQTRAGRPLTGTVTENVRMLAATKRNISRSRVSVPAGFTRVSENQVEGPVFQYYR